mgnify:CR=1 FL=1
MRGLLTVMRIETERTGQLTPEAAEAVARVSDLFGYGPYVARLALRPDQTAHASDNREELAAINAAASSSAGEEAVDALVMLGYTKTEAASAVGRLDQSLSSEELIKQALRLISKNI